MLQLVDKVMAVKDMRTSLGLTEKTKLKLTVRKLEMQ